MEFAEAAREASIATVFGAELSRELTQRQNGIPGPQGHLLVLAATPMATGGRRPSAAILPRRSCAAARADPPTTSMSSRPRTTAGGWS